MKRINQISTLLIISSLLVLASFSSCSKKDIGDVDTGEKYLTCKLNGKDYSFNFRVNANDKPVKKEVNYVVIGGFEKEDMITGFGIDMLIPGEGAKEQTYMVAGGATPELDGQYYIQNYKDGKLVSTTVYDGGRTTGTNFTLTITSLTAWGVKGTFSGKLKLTGGDTYINVTDGKFSAPYN